MDALTFDTALTAVRALGGLGKRPVAGVPKTGFPRQGATPAEGS
ncbi:hypothetical protein TRM7557_01889 [Tritonibacter multivorans]|uniref:Uncharacterized protein n=1 Tax=Tritonibacter multivorans TaxID=928856 RepID=A0A0P1GAK5_9RHOB|nr:hypothetical protein TRM7557_01889 [Tritonibacter multivorans]SFD17150.1 hypothetical protein SAMN04488049_10860 [Tritonibacter multivorans]